MKDKTNKTRVIIFIGGILILVGLIWFSLDFVFADYDEDCLKEFAKDYCEDNGFTLNWGNEIFICDIDYNPREDNNPKTEKFYYLDSEKESCLIKGSWSFKKIERIYNLGNSTITYKPNQTLLEEMKNRIIISKDYCKLVDCPELNSYCFECNQAI